MFSRDTVEFFVELLPQIQLRADDPEFERKAERLARVRRELNAALAEDDTGNGKPQPQTRPARSGST